MQMNIQNSPDPTTFSSSPSSFRTMLNDFINLDVTRTNSGAHKNLQRSIQQFTKTVECWGQSIQVLLTQDNPNVLTLCASILKNKLQHDFSQLNQQTFRELHESLLQVISKHRGGGTSAFRNHLSVCIAFVYIHKFEEIGELLPYLSKCFQNGEVNYVYTVLLVLPEEIDNNELVVEEDKRMRIRKYLKTIQRTVLIELNNIASLAWNSKEVKPRTLLQCFSNWIDLDLDIEVLESLPGHILLNKAFQQIQNSKVNSECVTVIKNTIRSIQTPNKNPQLYKFLAVKIIGFFELINNKKDEEIFLCEDYVYILATFARASRDEFIANLSQDYRLFLNNMLEITSNKEFVILALIAFWEKFMLSIVKNQQAVDFYRGQLRALYKIFSRVTAFSLRQCEKLNEKSSYVLEKQDGDYAKKIERRREAEDIFRLLAEALGHQECLELSLASITELQMTDKYFWPQIECHLNPLENIIDQNTELSTTLDSLVAKLLSITSPYVIVQKTFIRILSNCSILYSNNSQVSLHIFNILVSQIDIPQMSTTVGRAFQHTCTNNYQFVLANINTFVSIVLKHSANDRILKGVMMALAKDVDKLNEYFPVIFKEYMGQLSRTGEIKELKLILEQMIVMFKDITGEQSEGGYSNVVSQCYAELWKSLKQVLQKECKSADEESLLEKCAKVIKYALRCLKQSFQPFLDDLYSTILQAYTHYPIGSYVYLVEVLVTIFNETPQLFQPITILFEKVCQITFGHLSKLNDIESNQSLTEDFFGMLSRFMRFIPQIVNNFPQFQSLLHLVNIGCGINNGLLARVFYSFIEDMYMQFWDIQLVRQYMKDQRPIDKVLTERSEEMYESREKVRNLVFGNTFSLLIKMIQHLSEVPSSSVRHCIIDALLAEVKAFPNENQQIWFRIFETIPEKILTNKEKNNFLEMIPDLSESHLEDIEELINLISKRYVHESVRSPIN